MASSDTGHAWSIYYWWDERVGGFLARVYLTKYPVPARYWTTRRWVRMFRGNSAVYKRPGVALSLDLGFCVDISSRECGGWRRSLVAVYEDWMPSMFRRNNASIRRRSPRQWRDCDRLRFLTTKEASRICHEKYVPTKEYHLLLFFYYLFRTKSIAACVLEV